MSMRFSAVLAVTLVAIGCNKGTSDRDADNTKRNERDRTAESKTPLDQGENEADRTITQNIRKDVMGSDLSQTAKNVKIVTKDGIVTLRGPVDNDTERSRIETVAVNTTGVKRVDNQLEVKHD